MNISIEVIAGWFRLGIGAKEIHASYIDEDFPLSFLNALENWAQSRPYHLEADEEGSGGSVIFLHFGADSSCKLIVSEFAEYDSGMGLPVDTERADVSVISCSGPGVFGLSVERNSDSSALPHGLWVIEEEVDPIEFVRALVLVLSAEIQRLGGIRKFFEAWCHYYFAGVTKREKRKTLIDFSDQLGRIRNLVGLSETP